MKFKHSLLAVAMAASFGFATLATAATDSNNFDAVITLTNSCDVSTASISDLDFGSKTIADTNIDTSTDITVKCTTNATYDVGLSGTIGSRTMSKGAFTIPYEMYSDTSRTTAWGASSGTTVAGTGTGLDQTLTVYGRVASIPASAEAGNYSDTVTVTVTY